MDNYILKGINGDLMRAQAALMEVAKADRVPYETVCSEISIAIREAIDHGDAFAKALWAKCPRIGEYPTPEETIAFISSLLK